MNITDSKVSQYIESHYRPLSPFLGELRGEAYATNIPVIQKETETLLVTLLALQKPMRILEIGTAIGYSALCFATVLPQASIFTLELQKTMQDKAEDNIKRAGFSDRITVIPGDAVESLKRFTRQEKEGLFSKVDFIFLDGAKGHYKEIWDLIIKLSHTGTVVVADNVLYRSMTAADEYLDVRRNKTIVNRMRAFLSHITSLNGVKTTILPVGDGVSISVIEEQYETN